VVVNFFASWCVPCVREHPELVAFAAAHEGDVQVVSVVFDDDPGAVEAFFAREGGDWPVVVGDTGRIALDFGVTGVPESYLVAPTGVVVAAFYGVTQRLLDEALAEFGATVPTAVPGTVAPTTTGPGGA
jgi:cytochrome c biogenesis protein CcmG/thiol:disulfide interchange protein DsbE